MPLFVPVKVYFCSCKGVCLYLSGCIFAHKTIGTVVNFFFLWFFILLFSLESFPWYAISATPGTTVEQLIQ